MQRLEQEKHILRRKLSEAESEGDIRAQELESDYNEIKSKMLAQVSDGYLHEHLVDKIDECSYLHR